MLFRTRSNMLFRLFCLLTAQGGSVLAAIRFIFENCHNLKQKTEVVKLFLAFTSVFLFGGCATAPLRWLLWLDESNIICIHRIFYIKLWGAIFWDMI